MIAYNSVMVVYHSASECRHSVMLKAANVMVFLPYCYIRIYTYINNLQSILSLWFGSMDPDTYRGQYRSAPISSPPAKKSNTYCPPGDTYVHRARNRAWRHCQAIVHACNKALRHCLAVVHVRNMTYVIVWPSSMWLKLPLGDVSHKWFIDGTGGRYGKVSVRRPPVSGLVSVRPDPGRTEPEA